MKDFSLFNYLEKIQAGTISHAELNKLIEYNFKIAISFLKNYYKSKINHKAFYFLPLEDLAIDAIVPLFVKDKKGILGIKKTLSKWNDPIINESDAELFMSKLIWKSSDQAITQLLKENDPIFEKILKTLNTCIAQYNIKKIRYFGTVYIVEKNITEISGKILKYESFYKLPEDIFKYKQITLFEKIFEYLKNETDFTQAIPLNLLVRRIKEYHLTNHSENNYSGNSHINNTFMYEEIVKVGLDHIQDKIDNFYIPNKKITGNDAELIMSTFKDISVDMLNGGMNGSLYDYFKYRKNDLSSEIFYSDYHPLLNNLLKKFKNKISTLVE